MDIDISGTIAVQATLFVAAGRAAAKLLMVGL
jgi:hypothetical protein